jgi:hypothetical protein
MKTKAKKPTRKRVVKKVAKAPASAPSSTVVVHVRPHFAEFFHNGEEAASERVNNGHRNSDAYAALAKKLLDLSDRGVAVTLRNFDAKGNEIPSP